MKREHMARTAIAAILTSVVMGTPSNGAEVLVSHPGLADVLNSLRLTEGLGALAVDPILSDVMQRRLDAAMTEEGAGAPRDAQWAGDAVATVPDWDMSYFVAHGRSDRDLLAGLQSQPGFSAALLRSDVTHLALACRESDGTRGCVVCVIRRLIDLGPFEVDVHLDGPTTLTVSGESRYPLLRARFYKADEDPRTYEGPDYRVDVRTDDAGVFRVRLPISLFGKGHYQIILYVRGDSEGDYRIAARTRFDVSE